MLALVCEKCGGKLSLINSRTAYCENCGTEFSLMHSSSGNLDANIENFLMIAKDAYCSGNKVTTEIYCNRIIEIDSNNAEAYLLKGKAIGWQSSINHFRFKEASVCFGKALKSAISEEECKEIHNCVEQEFANMATALIKLRCERFLKWPDSDEAIGFKEDLDEVKEAVALYCQETGQKINKDNIFGNVSSMVGKCIMHVSKNILVEYKLSGDRSSYLEFKDRVENCVDIMERTINLCDNDCDEDVILYKQCICLLEMLIEQNTTDQIQNRWGAYIDTPRLSASDRQRINTKINIYKAKL